MNIILLILLNGLGLSAIDLLLPLADCECGGAEWTIGVEPGEDKEDGDRELEASVHDLPG